MAKHPLPKWLYEPLPYIYVGVGFLTMIKMHQAIGIISGLLLLSAGLLIWRTRQIYRSAARQTVALKSRDAIKNGNHRHPGLIKLVWSDDYESGYEVIDNQHHKLFDLGNELLNAIMEKKSKLDVELLLDELIQHITDHFCTEETLLSRAKHPLTPAHQDTHRRLIARSKEMAAGYHNDKLRAGDLFHFIAMDVVSGHILNEDLKFLGPLESADTPPRNCRRIN